MTKHYLVFLELRSGAIAKPSIAVWNRFQQLVSERGGRVSGFAAGPAAEGAFDLLQGSGTLHHAGAEGFGFACDEAVRGMIETLAGEKGITAIAFASTAMGRRLAPLLAGRLGATLFGGCTDFDADEGVCRCLIHSGAVVASYSSASPVTVYLQGRELAASGFTSAAKPLIEAYDAAPYPVSGINPLVLAVREGVHGLDISEASVVVAGGRGMGGTEAFGLLDELAGLLGGSVGASRSAVDEGWRPHGEQIGQSGKRIAPDLYIACGISGALQHLAGISAARTVVAVNSDPDAPIFGVADYGIIGDVKAILPGMIVAARDLLKKK